MLKVSLAKDGILFLARLASSLLDSKVEVQCVQISTRWAALDTEQPNSTKDCKNMRS